MISYVVTLGPTTTYSVMLGGIVVNPVVNPPISAGDWASITGKPTTFPPDAHGHAIGEISGLATALTGKADASHTHSIANVTGLQTALDGKAAISHTHGISDVTGLQTVLDAKAALAGATFTGAVSSPAFIVTSGAIVTDASTARTLSAGDNGEILRFTSGSAVTVTVNDTLPVGFSCLIIQEGAGKVSLVGSGATIRNRFSQLSVGGQYGSATLVKVSAGEYRWQGDTGA
jgi:hypothetical protein